MSPERHRVLLVREWDEQMSGSGCCGRLGSEVVGSMAEHAAGPRPYERTRVEMQRFGQVYRALADRFGEDIDITVVDPRNAIWLVPAIWRDARRRGLTSAEALRQVRAGTAARALVCDGTVLMSGAVPDAAAAVAAVEADIGKGRALP